ncbi:hypothetical protein BDQ17DRAFT_1392882 [Cyathus striatus]|nr:hypothetical protein BDQ17DRAFT_1392882 [Cyathus striatus]
MPPTRHSLFRYPCKFLGCMKVCRKPGGLTQHQSHCKFNPKNIHRCTPLPEHPLHDIPGFQVDGGLALDPKALPLNPDHNDQPECLSTWTRHGDSGTPCDEDGYDLPEGAPPPPPPPHSVNIEMPASPFRSAEEFELADLIFNKIHMSATEINSLMDIWTRLNEQDGAVENGASSDAPFSSTNDLYDTIDSITLGDIPWQAFTMQHTGETIDQNSPSWMTHTYEVWFCDPLSVMESQIGNPDLAREMDFAPKQVKGKDEQQQYCNFMSGNWAWDQADIIAGNPETHGSMFAPIILGSDKTTVSVATGQNEYYPLYASLGNVQNHVRRAHRNAVTVVGFLAIPKTDKQYEKSAAFRKFRRQLFHASLAYILQSLKPWMTKPKVTHCGNGYFYHVIYGIGPYIADYPEQCLLACIVSGWCVRCTAFFNDLDNQEEASLHSYEHTKALYDAVGGNHRALWDGYGIIADIVPFTSNFLQADIHELIVPDLLHQIIKGTFKDHLVNWVIKYINISHEKKEADRIIGEIDHRIAVVPLFPGLCHFPKGRGFKQWTGDDSKALMKVFLPTITGLVPDKMVRALAAFLEICYLQFGAPNGLCSSITESKHIKAVKEPWRCSNRYNALGQMLLTNERLDKLNAFRIDLQSRNLLPGFISDPVVPASVGNDDLDIWADEGIHSDSDTLDGLSDFVGIPHLRENIHRFLYDQLNPGADVMGMEVNLNTCPIVNPLLTVNVFHYAISLFHAPSDLSGIGGMHREIIHATPTWWNGEAHHDCIFVANNTDNDGFRGLNAAQVHLFFSFTYNNILYPCAFVHWFETYGDNPCRNTGLWMVEPHFDALQRRLTSVIHVDTILRSAHLIPVFGRRFIPSHLKFSNSLHAFALYYINKYADHHSHEVAF